MVRKSMRWQLWHNGLGGPVLAFWEGVMLMIKEGYSLVDSFVDTDAAANVYAHL